LKVQRNEGKDLVERILKDPAAYAALKAQLETESGERLETLLRAIDASNPPVLGTGGTE
jgi:hypothetical protein